VGALVTVHTAAAVREVVGGWRAAHRSVALVPTMGNLHRGHLFLADEAKGSADCVLMTIFVNPTQFGAGEDFGSYPRTLEEDAQAIRDAGTVNALFVPEVPEIYPFGIDDAVGVRMPALSRELCGEYRPGHFDGVANVVLRLINIVQPDTLILGEKDFQQLVLVKRLVADLRLPVSVQGASIQREADGLALSSRNRYLNAQERARAHELHKTLVDVCDAIRRGERGYAQLEERARTNLARHGFNVDYVEIRDTATLARPGNGEHGRGLLVLAAAWLGRARLIDNVRV
jgi:pantoate--beta-alanine ligase